MRCNVVRVPALLAVGVILLLTSAVMAEKKAVMPAKEIKGSVPDETLAKDAPTVITSAQGLEKLWKSWKLTDKMPEVDFTKELIVVTTTRGSQVKVSLTLDETGNLAVIAIGTADLGQGFRYVLDIVPKEGVKTVNNKELPKE